MCCNFYGWHQFQVPDSSDESLEDGGAFRHPRKTLGKHTRARTQDALPQGVFSLSASVEVRKCGIPHFRKWGWWLVVDDYSAPPASTDDCRMASCNRAKLTLKSPSALCTILPLKKQRVKILS
mmetsp:Transcript_6982/g.14308  ORF Transcript_6982/g.14308 Transcript_6982/m.14308 type:complete len:123 (-) Transcript_6982:1058-1426(-)